MRRINLNTLIFILFISLLLTAAYLSYQKGKQAEQQKEISREIKKSQSIEKHYKDSLSVLQYNLEEHSKKEDIFIYRLAELNQKYQNLKKNYNQEKVEKQGITSEKIKTYTDTLCKQDVIRLQKYLQNAEVLISTIEEKLTWQDSLIFYKDIQIENQTQQINLSKNILVEKEKQIQLLQSTRVKKTILGIGMFAGAGLGPEQSQRVNNIFPTIGVGLTLNLIPLIRK